MALTMVTHGQQTLPPKEASLFRKCVKLYEQKQHKNSLRCIKQILQNPACQEHGETLSMKALILDVTGHHPESVELAHRALKNDVKSHVCWHIFGMIKRSDKKYDESMRALKRSLQLSPDNPQILRDLALIQVHTRDFRGYQESRYALLRMKPNNRQAWMSFIVAAYLAKDYETALKGLSEYKRPLIQNPDANSAELFELQQFEVRLYEESGNLDKAVEAATDSSCPFLDQTVLHETLGRLYFKQGKLDEAAKEYEELIKRNPEQGKYYKSL
uniref:Uncharacterized protein n=1 Tax=Panagrolaimus sp. JU765 TaxID=591449 RepID=A0AC34QAB7_9BILA